MIKLSERLKAIAGFVERGETVADVGTDHGFLPLYLLEEGISPFVVMTDVSPGSLHKAEKSCREELGGGFDRRKGGDFDLRLGDGLAPVKLGETCVVVMAGMGGLLMAEILGNDPAKSGSFKKFILQPRNNAGKLRKWLCLSGYEITRETLVRERKRICEIIEARPPQVKADVIQAAELADDVEFEYPSALAECPNALTGEYLKRCLEKERIIRTRILKGKDRGKLALTEARIERIDELLGALENEDKRSNKDNR